MSVTSLSASSQNYLKAIWSLGEWSDQPITPSLVAARVGVRLSTASDAVRKLTDQGLLHHTPYGAVALTDQGRAHALMMVRRHRLIETFLVDVLGYRWDQVHEEAETLEHAVSEFLIERIDEHLGHPEHDPHGDPIPRADGTVTALEAITLTALGTGARARVARISDEDPGLLQFLAQVGIGVGTIIETRAGAPYSDSVEVVVNGQRMPLGRSASDAVWVTPDTPESPAPAGGDD
ncbi:metal-dependent transcriptional regulator [Gephyromycinifex aptenodytis]|uniref:metal-dependent transcriptional regulator n=1 Tax=Gephyromycinifex aptenodytis TaxID=2716227 RepID=UPI001444CA96|nr:metal-dependent transcriptional regulator [Gephyromycinifex aptenodytis]